MTSENQQKFQEAVEHIQQDLHKLEDDVGKIGKHSRWEKIWIPLIVALISGIAGYLTHKVQVDQQAQSIYDKDINHVVLNNDGPERWEKMRTLMVIDWQRRKGRALSPEEEGDIEAFIRQRKAQSGFTVFLGKVTNNQGQPLTGVKVELPEVGLETVTNIYGLYEISSSSHATLYELRFSKSNYAPMNLISEFEPGHYHAIDFVMDKRLN